MIETRVISFFEVKILNEIETRRGIKWSALLTHKSTPVSFIVKNEGNGSPTIIKPVKINETSNAFLNALKTEASKVIAHIPTAHQPIDEEALGNLVSCAGDGDLKDALPLFFKTFAKGH